MDNMSSLAYYRTTIVGTSPNQHANSGSGICGSKGAPNVPKLIITLTAAIGV